MADAESALPPSKKRVAGRELSRDNPGLDDEECPEQEFGTFKRASEEVLATRKIVKVRRQQPVSAGTLASTNPFASIQLVPPIQSNEKTTIEESGGAPTAGEENKVMDTVKKESNVIELNGSETENEKKEESLVVEADEIKKDLANEASEKVEAKREEVKAEGEEAKNETTSEKVEENSEAGDKGSKTENVTPASSFLKLSNSENAFSNLAGKGFSGSSFSFGFPKDGSGFGASGSLFGLKVEKSSFSLGIGGSDNGTSSNSIRSSAPVMQEVPVETGEENESVVFAADAVLFEYANGGWKERGKGELKVNVSTTQPERARLVMRGRGNLRLILNANLYPDMKLTNMDKRGITFACVNSGGEGKSGLSTFALKFRDLTFVEQFRAVVEAHKSTKSAALKTPENSPKASNG